MATPPLSDSSNLGDHINALIKDHLAAAEKPKAADTESKKADMLVDMAGMRDQIIGQSFHTVLYHRERC